TTNIDYINTSNIHYNKQESSSTISDINSDIDMIAKEIKSTTPCALKRQHKPMTKSSNQDTEPGFTKENPTS
ncbi:3473_t:CDS:1, partial [Cetraspora pellucida]